MTVDLCVEAVDPEVPCGLQLEMDARNRRITE
jgi:hypothetical protein